MNLERPNLFYYGRKELSQDAMICWLLAWSNERFAGADPHLHNCGQKFVRTLFAKHDKLGPESIKTVALGRQVKGIDVLAWINDKYAILIEDKTDAGVHGDQLKKYHKLVLDGKLRIHEDKVKVAPCRDDFFPLFLKTGNMSRHQETCVEAIKLDPPYRIFKRGDFLDALKGCEQTKSHILADFLAHLKKREVSFISYKKTPLDQWWWDSWEGFYRCLEEILDSEDVDWGYVPNRGGGFLGLWWHSTCGGGGDKVYLQAEQDKLCFKISVQDKERRREHREYWHKKIMDAAKSIEMPVEKPYRFGTGQTMTVAVLNDWRGKDERGLLEMDATVGVLRRAEQVLDAATS